MDDASEQPFPRKLSGATVKRLPEGLVPSRAPLVGRHVRLEPLNPMLHGAELYQASHGTEAALRIWDYLPAGPWPDEPAFTTWLRTQAALFERVVYVLRPTQSGIAAGMASYLDIHPLDGVIEIGGIWFAPELQRTRAATEALFLLLAYAMDGLGYRRMQWRCNSLNVKSRAAARRLGFRFEGVFYNHMVVKGRNRDTAWYSILDDEWPEVCANITGWLDDGNFDVAGTAKRSLTDMINQRRPSHHGLARPSG
jgi:RimJ/RimL family protein N-acetyltransferase